METWKESILMISFTLLKLDFVIVRPNLACTMLQQNIIEQISCQKARILILDTSQIWCFETNRSNVKFRKNLRMETYIQYFASLSDYVFS